MTTIIVVLIGIGVTFIASSLDCTPIRDTFSKIVSNQPIDWTGTQNCQANIPQEPYVPAPGQAPSSATIGAGTQGRLKNPCPDGTCNCYTSYTPVLVSNGKIMCEKR